MACYVATSVSMDSRLTDDLGAMHATTDRYSPELAVLEAFRAGTDLFVVSGPALSARMVEALRAEAATPAGAERLANAVRRVLRAKQRLGLVGPLPNRRVTSSTC